MTDCIILSIQRLFIRPQISAHSLSRLLSKILRENSPANMQPIRIYEMSPFQSAQTASDMKQVDSAAEPFSTKKTHQAPVTRLQ